MSNDIAIRIEGLGKRYQLGETVDLARDFRETVMSLPRVFGRRVLGALGKKSSATGQASDSNVLWALRDIDLEVNRGEVIGIIGSNGAGKSTLLKILSRITLPTTGFAEIRGRVGSLLEVGTGMHHELTGRENIFLNGAILGMRKAEIERRFDEIVAFSEVERFLNTPVKRYSSGMRVRLAFAVAAHLEPEILIVDEVLAVGDAEFRRKCLGKMKSVAGGGRTVLFVSHNMQAVKNLCEKAVLLRDGRIAERGDASSIVQSYLASGHRETPSLEITTDMHRYYPPALEIHQVELLNAAGEPSPQVLLGERFSLRMHYRVREPDRTYFVSVSIRTQDGLLVGTASSLDDIETIPAERDSEHWLMVQLQNVLSSGEYFLELKVKAAQTVVDIIEGIPLTVARVASNDRAERQGLVQFNAAWRSDTQAPADTPQDG